MALEHGGVSVSGTVWVGGRIEIGLEGKLEVILRTLAFALSEMGSSWRILRKGVI